MSPSSDLAFRRTPPRAPLLDRLASHALAQRLLAVAVSAVLLGRAWQHLRWNAPYWALFWSEELFAPTAQLLTGMSWNEWASSRAVEQTITTGVRLLGVLYAVTGAWLLADTLRSAARSDASAPQDQAFDGGRGAWLDRALGACLAALMSLAVVDTLDNKHHLGHLLEQTLQWGSVLALLLWRAGAHRAGGWALRGAIAATFFGHALYAGGYYEVPGAFVTMVMTGFRVTEAVAFDILFAAALFDCFVAVSVLLAPSVALLAPSASLSRLVDELALSHAVAWGTLTALARVVTNFERQFVVSWLETWGHETVFRLVNGLAPLAVLVLASPVVTRSLLRGGRLSEPRDADAERDFATAAWVAPSERTLG